MKLLFPFIIPNTVDEFVFFGCSLSGWRLSRREWMLFSAVMKSRMLFLRHGSRTDLPCLTGANSSQELVATVEQLTLQRDAAKNELDMAQDTARTYYQRMVQAESEKSQLKTTMVTQKDRGSHCSW